MPIHTLNGRDYLFTDSGFLQDPNTWSKVFAIALAALVPLQLTQAHWQVIDYLRSRFQTSGEIPTLRHLCTDLGLSLPKLYQLFPEGRRQACRIAGLHKPQGCRDN